MTKSTPIPNGQGIFLLIRFLVFIAIQIVIPPPGIASAQERLADADLLETVELAGETHHVQGIDVDRTRLWVTSVDSKQKRGLILLYELPEKEPRRVMEIQQGSRFHAGGFSADGDSLWIPVAEYVRGSTSIVQQRNKQTLQLESEFEVADHIGAIAVVPEGLLGANWDANDFYVWDKHGRLQRKFANPHPVAIQDMKFVDGRLVVGGLLADRSGVVDWLEWPSLKLSRRITTGPTDRGVSYTNEGMTVRGGKLWLLPEDAPSRLFVFRLSK
jgi:Family of unknown function (DUF6454)